MALFSENVRLGDLVSWAVYLPVIAARSVLFQVDRSGSWRSRGNVFHQRRQHREERKTEEERSNGLRWRKCSEKGELGQEGKKSQEGNTAVTPVAWRAKLCVDEVTTQGL